MNSDLESFCGKVGTVVFFFGQTIQYLEDGVTANEAGFIKLFASGQLGGN
jgi:hypothetical protein